MNAFDRTFARLLLEICRYTYSAAFKKGEEKDLKDALAFITAHSAPAPELIMLQDDDKIPTSVVCVAVFADKNVVSYMGTKTKFDTPPDALASLKDWLQNLEAHPVPFQLTAEQLGADIPQKNNLGGMVHEGFLKQLGKIQGQVVQTLEKHGGKAKPLFATGHSQGGAEAALATRALLAGGYNLQASYTFAAPRAGDAGFAASIPDTFPCHRLEFGDDIVPHVPPKALSKNAQDILDVLLKLPLGAKEKASLEYLKKYATKTSFTGAGRLCYGDNKDKVLQVDMSADAENSLFGARLKRLLKSPKNWGEHHHLAGTTEETNAGHKGNYTALVSDFVLKS